MASHIHIPESPRLSNDWVTEGFVFVYPNSDHHTFVVTSDLTACEGEQNNATAKERMLLWDELCSYPILAILNMTPTLSHHLKML